MAGKPRIRKRQTKTKRTKAIKKKKPAYKISKGRLYHKASGKSVKLSTYKGSLSSAIKGLRQGRGTGGKSTYTKSRGKTAYKSQKGKSFFDIPAGTPMVSSGGKVWYKGFKNVGTFKTISEASKHSVLTKDSSGKYSYISRESFLAGQKYKSERTKEKQQREKREYKQYLETIKQQRKVDRLALIRKEKSGIEKILAERISKLRQKRYSPRMEAQAKTQLEDLKTKLARSRARTGEMWLSNINTILGTQKSPITRIRRRIVRRKMPNRTINRR